MHASAEIAALAAAVFLGGVVSGFSGFAFSAAAVGVPDGAFQHAVSGRPEGLPLAGLPERKVPFPAGHAIVAND